MLEPGETVLDLGSGGGLDVLLSARRVGPDGVAYGLDASTDMLSLARANTAQAGVLNARFLQGHVENIPLPDDHVDVIISNCVINLSVDKPRALAEAFRVLRSGVASASAMSSQTMESTPVSARTRSSKSAAWPAPHSNRVQGPTRRSRLRSTLASPSPTRREPVFTLRSSRRLSR